MVLARTDIAGVAATLQQERSVYYWLLLKQPEAASEWQVHALLIEAFPQPSNGRSPDRFACDYDHVVALGGRASGEDIGSWLTRGHGEAVSSDPSAASRRYSFTMPPIVSPAVPNIQPRQVSRHL